MHVLNRHLLRDPDPVALVKPSAFTRRQLERWQHRLAHKSCTPFAVVPLAVPLTAPSSLPTFCVSTDAAKVEPRNKHWG
eukprot:5094221-Pleurochrysis_carterae.AAC.1